MSGQKKNFFSGKKTCDGMVQQIIVSTSIVRNCGNNVLLYFGFYTFLESDVLDLIGNSKEIK